MEIIGFLILGLGVTFAFKLLRFLIRAPVDIPRRAKQRSLTELIESQNDFDSAWTITYRPLNGIGIDLGRKKFCIIVNQSDIAAPYVFTHTDLLDSWCYPSYEDRYIALSLKSAEVAEYKLYFSSRPTQQDSIRFDVTSRLLSALTSAARKETGLEIYQDGNTDAINGFGTESGRILQSLLKANPLEETEHLVTHDEEHFILTNKRIYLIQQERAIYKDWIISLSDIKQMQTFEERARGNVVDLRLKSGELIKVSNPGWSASFLMVFLKVCELQNTLSIQ